MMAKIKTITDEEILDLINAGRIVVTHLHRKSPVIIKDGVTLTPSIVMGGRGSNLPRYRVEICLPKVGRRRKRKRTIIRAKLVWMYVHRRVVPLGHEIHHRDEDRLNDRRANLVNWTEKQHHDHHNGVPF